MANILIVDDEDIAREALQDMLMEGGHDCIVASSATEARLQLEGHPCEVVLTDYNMPGENGLDLIQSISKIYRDLAIIMVTAMDDQLIAESALQKGSFDFVTKPISLNRLLISISNALHRRDLEIANRTYRDDLKSLIEVRTQKLEKALDGIVQTIALTVERRDPYTAGHQKRVADLACAIATELRISEKMLEGIKVAALIHDLGKISLPGEILTKPGRLTENEFNLIKEHSQIGYDIIKDIDFPWPIADIILQHHEKCDGSGYPLHLTGDDILLETKIITVADVVEAIASHRPYRPGRGFTEAFEVITKGKDTLFDPAVVDACLKLHQENRFPLEDVV
jgi:putative nucleotidyltransferase with HDIG domain